MASLDISTASRAAGKNAGQESAATGLELPSIEQVLSDLSEVSSSLPSRTSETLPQEEQEIMFRALKNVVEIFESSAESISSFDLKELHSSLEQADADASRGQRDAEPLQNVHTILCKLWSVNSGFLSQAAEALANGSRDRELIFSWGFESLH